MKTIRLPSGSLIFLAKAADFAIIEENSENEERLWKRER
jgi:hypothetical protein